MQILLKKHPYITTTSAIKKKQKHCYF